jgi:hypothetical protein
MRRNIRIVAAAGLLTISAVTAVSATPVASNKQQAALLGRVIPEPLKSANFIQFDPSAGDKELDQAFTLLQQMYPRYISYTTIAKALHDPRAVSSGGHPLPVITVTDRTVPDKNKQYVLLTFAHSAEPCGREGVLRSAEDLAIAATKAPNTTYDDGTLGGLTHRFTARQLLQRLKIYIIVTSPDGWVQGDVGNGAGQYSQYTANGINSNRVAYQTGWVFSTKLLKQHGYTTATQPEGIAVTRFLRRVRAGQLHGRPFAAAADIHGPLPTGAILIHDVGDDPAKRDRLQDLAKRVLQRMDGVFESYATHQGATTYATAASYAESVRALLVRYGVVPSGSIEASYPLQWAAESGIWDLLGYTVSSTWGQFMNDGNVGIGADAISYEINCLSYAPWDPAQMQLFVDNVRAIVQTTLVHAAALPRLEAKPLAVTNLRGRVGYYDSGNRVTSKDGVGVKVPNGYPGVPLWHQLKQMPYDVSQTDIFTELQREHLVSRPMLRVTPAHLAADLRRLDTLVIADQLVPPATHAQLARWVRGGGNLVLTDRALQLMSKVGLGNQSGQPKATLKWGYLGYADLDHSDPLTTGLPSTARELYDPVGLGYPLNMLRDAYWSCSGTQSTCSSGTQNSAPIWTVPTAAINAFQSARVIGTVDPPATRQSVNEGTGTALSDIGIVPLGRGRIDYFGGLLPRPTEAYPHFFGLFGNTVTYIGQTMLLRAMTWQRP